MNPCASEQLNSLDGLLVRTFAPHRLVCFRSRSIKAYLNEDVGITGNPSSMNRSYKKPVCQYLYEEPSTGELLDDVEEVRDHKGLAAFKHHLCTWCQKLGELSNDVKVIRPG